MHLGDLYVIKSGLVVSRKKVSDKNNSKFTYKQLNLRSINKGAYIDKYELEELKTDEIISDEYLTNEGDIVIRLTDPYTAVYITDEMKGLVITSNFAVIRGNANFSKEYLTFYLNSEYVRKMLYSNMQGSIVKSISILAIENIDLPNILEEVQSKYAILLKLLQKRKQIIQNLYQSHDSLMKSIINKSLK